LQIIANQIKRIYTYLLIELTISIGYQRKN
jgi:hypothetical protein